MGKPVANDTVVFFIHQFVTILAGDFAARNLNDTHIKLIGNQQRFLVVIKKIMDSKTKIPDKKLSILVNDTEKLVS